MEQLPGWVDVAPKPPRVLAVSVAADLHPTLDACCERVGARVVHRTPISVEQLDRLLDSTAPSVVVLAGPFDTAPAELLRRLKAPPHRAFLPVLALVSTTAEQRAVWSAGFDMALAAPHTSEDVDAVLTGLLNRHDQVQRQLGIDASTGLLAPQAFFERVDEAISLARRYQMTGCLGVVHVGHDAWAHGKAPEKRQLEVTPLTLRWAAALARAALREVDVLGITGERSLGVIFYGTTIGGAIVAMRRVIDFLQAATDNTTERNEMLMEVTGAVASFGNDGLEGLMSRFVRALTARRDRSPGTLIIV